MKGGFVYILTNKNKSTLYVGVTSDLKQRVYEHKTGRGSVFTSKYRINKLVWFDEFPTIEDAIAREKQIKKWKRDWKLELITNFNADFKDLYDEI